MIINVTEAHPELYHYTTAGGLEGIISSQKFHATSISYLNDAEEHTGFFDRRLRELLADPVSEAIKRCMETPDRRDFISGYGGPEEAAIKIVDEFICSAKDVTINFNDPYVVSLSAPPVKYRDDGLLSQWRGYGVDGGYALVFDTAGLDKLLRAENSLFHYQMGNWGDVEYYDQETPGNARHPETKSYQDAIKETMRNFLVSGSRTELEPMLEPITMLSLSHKHHGFREEEEVRIVFVRAKSEVEHLAKESGDLRPLRPIKFRQKYGMLVPYIEVFGGELGSEFRLPIKKIIVGPHPDKEKRRIAVEYLLRQHNLNAEVSVSSIPYLGA